MSVPPHELPCFIVQSKLLSIAELLVPVFVVGDSDHLAVFDEYEESPLVGYLCGVHQGDLDDRIMQRWITFLTGELIEPSLPMVHIDDNINEDSTTINLLA